MSQETEKENLEIETELRQIEKEERLERMERKAREWQERQVEKKDFERKEINPGIQKIRRIFEKEEIGNVPVTKKQVNRVELIRETFEVKTKRKEVDRETVKESKVRQMASPFEQMMNKETRKKADMREKEREKKKTM